MDARGVGLAVTCTLGGSAALTWAVRRPAERLGARAALGALALLSVLAAALLLVSEHPWVVVLAAMIGNVAVGTGETGPFLSIEQVVVTRAVTGTRRTTVLSLYNLLGYAAGGLGAAIVGLTAPRALFAIFLAASVVQAVLYARLPAASPRRACPPVPDPRRPSSADSRRCLRSTRSPAAFVLQSLVAYFLHERYGLGLEALGQIFLGAQLVTAASLLLAPRARAGSGC